MINIIAKHKIKMLLRILKCIFVFINVFVDTFLLKNMYINIYTLIVKIKCTIDINENIILKILKKLNYKFLVDCKIFNFEL